jgi:beta-phosphoglucomutase family hydrolase
LLFLKSVHDAWATAIAGRLGLVVVRELAGKGLFFRLRQLMEIGAIFDWDGVIIDSRDQHERSWERLAQEEGLPLPEGHFLKGFGMKNERIIPSILRWTDESGEVRRLSLRKEALYRKIILEEGIEALPGVSEFLHRLADAGIPTVVGSSTHRENIVAILDVIGLRKFFARMVTSEDVSHGKPHPEVFLKAAEKIGVAPARCVVLEDAHVGIEAGLAGGMKVVAVTTTHPREELGKAHRIVDRLDELTGEDLRHLLAR